jgi:4-hydroxy-tetrahydrodipicolinate synthase
VALVALVGVTVYFALPQPVGGVEGVTEDHVPAKASTVVVGDGDVGLGVAVGFCERRLQPAVSAQARTHAAAADANLIQSLVSVSLAQNCRGDMMLLFMAFEGVYSILPTAFTDSGDLDKSSQRRVVDLFIEKGANGLTALGVTGEVARLEEHERANVLEIVVDQAAGRVPIIAGTSAEGTRTCISYTRQAKAIGASAVMVSPPRMPKLNSAAVVNHYKALADAVDLPIIVQDYPPIAGFAMEPALLARIAKEIPSARTIKLEDPPTPFKTARILEASAGTTVQIFGGLGGVFLLEELISGATGAMTGFAFPEILARIMKHWNAGERDAAADVFYRAVPLMRFEFQEGIGMAIRKEVLRRRGALASAATRAPAGALDGPTTQALDRVLTWVTTQKGMEWISV